MHRRSSWLASGLPHYAIGLTASTPGERALDRRARGGPRPRGPSPRSVTWPLARAALGEGRLALEQLPDGLAFYLCCDLAVDGEHYDVVDPALQVALDDARARGSIVGFAYASAFRAHSFMTQGMLTQAEAEARSAVQGIAEGGWHRLRRSRTDADRDARRPR